jgi:hypothetical protein
VHRPTPIGGYHDPAPRILIRFIGSYHCWSWRQCVGRWKNQIGANLHRDDLHDVVQQHVCQLPVVMRQRARCSHFVARQCFARQHCCRRIVHLLLHQPTADVSNKLLAQFAVAMIFAAQKRRRARQHTGKLSPRDSRRSRAPAGNAVRAARSE